MVCVLSVTRAPQCEHSSNSQLWKLYFSCVYVVIISSSHVTGCMCVFLCECVRACVWEHACEQGCACVYMTADQEGKWRRRQRRGESCRHYTAAEGERQSERERKEGTGQENHRQIKEWDRNKETNERSLSSLLLSTAGSSRCLRCRIHCKQMQTCSKNESVSA